MAESQVSLSFLKEQFDDQLTCSVCLDQYTNPKILPCHHSFCLTCIEPIPVEIKDGKYYISCPTCRVEHQLPQGGANNLPNDFKINSMLDLQNKLATTSPYAIPNPTQPTCPKHNDPLKVYCETCSHVICLSCTISTEHKDHTTYLISECYPKHHQQILDNLHTVKHKLADMNTAMTHLDTQEREVLQQGENIMKEINQHAQQLIGSIQQSQTHLTQQVDAIVQRKTQTLTTQKQQAQKLRTRLQTCQDTIEHNLKEWTQQQILAQKYTIMDEVNTATQHVDPTVFQPIENADIEFNIDENSLAIGTITSKTYSRATLEASPCLAKQPSTATLTLQSLDGSPFPLPPSLISSTLSSPGSEHSVKCPITQTQPGKHSIAFTSSTRQDRLIVQVGGVDVPDSPFTLPVTPTPEMRGEPVKIITGLDQPNSIAVRDNGDIVVAERDTDSITILNKAGKKLRSFPYIFPCGVAISSDGHILLTDYYQLHKLTTDGVCVKSVGTREIGNGQLQFNRLAGIAVHPTIGHIFVADSGNNRIQVFANDLTFSYTITPSGIFQRFDEPYDVALDNEGHLYVAERGNHCITKLSADKGKVVNRFGSNQLSCPTALTISHNLVYVSEYGKYVLIFDTDGIFITKLCEFEYRQSIYYSTFPWGITIDTLGNLYVSDTKNNRIVVY